MRIDLQSGSAEPIGAEGAPAPPERPLPNDVAREVEAGPLLGDPTAWQTCSP